MSVVPYILPKELLAESAGVDFSSLYPESMLTPEQKLMKVCREVTETLDDICGKYVYTSRKKYVLRSTEDTEADVTSERNQCVINHLGQLVFICNYRPVRSVTSVKWGAVTVAPQDMSVAPAGNVFIDGRDVVVTGMWESVRYIPVRVAVTYVNGFPNTVLTADAAAGQKLAVVDDLTGFMVGDVVEVMDDLAEGMTITAINVGTKTLTFAENFVGTHLTGVRLTEIPRTVHRAAMWLAWDIAQSHNRQAMSIAHMDLMGGQQIMHPVNYFKRAVDLLQDHGYILTP